MKRTLGVCYYPEHWPEDMWAIDTARMVENGLSWVRIGEFAWSRIEPAEGHFDLDWLDRAVEILGAAGLKIIMGTPTATPPKWVCEKHPDMFAVDADGKVRGFGSRRHYCFSHKGYRAESRRITEILAKRYGANPHIAAWQTDNEYGCHDTVISYSEHALAAFRNWLAQRYQSTDAMNRAWGNVFWSMDYDGFDQIDLPNLTVTEVNPSHAMAFRRFSSDMVVEFNREQTEILRRYTDAPLIHNYMGRVTEFDHFDVGVDLDIASWDSYPLGFLEDRMEDGDAHKRAYAQQGDPDFQAFHHDLYRAVGKGRWWIMEQQPGPVNWAPVNPAPLPGMCRLWAWEAFAHGAETVCYFRWRQAPFAQEQMHAGLLRPDSEAAPALAEAEQVARELKNLPDVETGNAQVALIFDYSSEWAWIVQPQGSGFSYFRLVFETYRALRKLGLDVDILPPNAPLESYKLVLAPGLLTLPEKQLSCSGITVIGPRANSKTKELTISQILPPNVSGLDAKVSFVETFRADMPRSIKGGGHAIHWIENLETTDPVQIETCDGQPVLIGSDATRYLGAWLDAEALDNMLRGLCDELAIKTVTLPDGIRIKRTQSHLFAFNYGREVAHFEGIKIEPAGVFWRTL
jgi:beta-galactosidase